MLGITQRAMNGRLQNVKRLLSYLNHRFNERHFSPRLFAVTPGIRLESAVEPAFGDARGFSARNGRSVARKPARDLGGRELEGARHDAGHGIEAGHNKAARSAGPRV